MGFHRSWLLVLIGCLGFVAGTFLLFQHDFSSPRKVFNEVEIDYSGLWRELTQCYPPDTVAQRIDRLSKTKNALETELTKVTATEDKQLKSQEIARVTQQIVFYRQIVKSTEALTLTVRRPGSKGNSIVVSFGQQHGISYQTIDSIQDYKAGNDVKDRLTAIQTKMNNACPHLAIVDSSNRVIFQSSVPLKLVDDKSNIEFITKYPFFGIWVLLVIIMVIFLCCATVLIFDRVRLGGIALLRSQPTGEYFISEGSKGIWISYGLCLLCTAGLISLIGWSCKKSFYDDTVVYDWLFMPSYGNAFNWLNGIGYSVAAFSFAAMIFTATLSGLTVERVRRKENQLQKVIQREGVVDEEMESATLELEGLQKSKIAFQDNQAELKKHFQFFFSLNAILLSLTVLTTSSLYAAINSLPFVQYLTDANGYPFARSEMVLLYGLLNTLLLALFYFPTSYATFQMDGLPASSTSKLTADSSWFQRLAALLQSLSGPLTAGLPLFVGIIQELIKILSGNA